MDRYSLLSLSVIAVIVIFSIFNISEDDSECIIGIAEDIHEKDTGYVFNIVDGNGNIVKAFCNYSVDDSLHSFIGTYSSDGSIFFINEIQ